MDLVAVSFAVDMVRCRDAQLLSAHLNGANSQNKLQRIIFGFYRCEQFQKYILKNKVMAKNIIVITLCYAPNLHGWSQPLDHVSSHSKVSVSCEHTNFQM